MPQHIVITPETLPKEIQALLGTVKALKYPQQGCTSDIVIALCERGKYVVKRSQGTQFSSWLAQEYRVLQALQELRLPLPQPYHYQQNFIANTVESWLVMSYLPGNSLRTVAQTTYDQATKQHILYSTGQMLAKLHSLPIPGILHAERQGSWLDSMLKHAHYNLLHYEVEGNAELLARLERHHPSEVTPTLIHGDFTIDNVLIADGEVSGIVDWAWGTMGDPRYDLALAIRPKAGVFQTPEDTQAFLYGYGATRLSKDEYDYFIGLYEFF